MPLKKSLLKIVPETLKLLKVSRVLCVEIAERILRKAEQLYFTYGFRGVTMDDIANELGISKKTIYLHFEDKNTLVEEVSKFFLNKEKCRVTEISGKQIGPIEEAILATRMMKEMMENINPVVFYDLQKYYPKAWKHYLEHKKYFLQTMKENLLKGIEEGLYRTDINVEIICRMRIELVELAFNTVVFPPKDFRLLEIQVSFIDHFIRGIVTQKGLKAYEAIK
jgi:AcrR family transcriptional regulator